MENKEVNEIFVFEDQEINQPQVMQRDSQKKRVQQYTHLNKPIVQNKKQPHAHEQFYGMASPSFNALSNKPKQQTFITKGLAPADQKSSKASNLVFEEQNAYSFRNKELKFPTKKQQQILNQLQIISDFNSQISNNEALVTDVNKNNNANQQIPRIPSRRKFKDIYDEESVKSQKGLRKMQQFNEPKRVIPNILNGQKQEQNNRTQDNLKIIQDDKSIKSGTMKRRRTSKIPPLQTEKSGQIFVNTSNIVSNQSSMIAINKKEDDLRFANASSLTKMEAIQNQYVKAALRILPQNKRLKCLFKRSKKCLLNYCHPQYSFYFSDEKFIANAKKQSCRINSHYNITSSQNEFNKEDQNYLGYLQGNFFGSCFNLYQLIDNTQELVCTICYESQLNCSLSARKIEVYIKNEKFATSSLYGINIRRDYNLKQLYNLGQNAQLKKVIKLVNKQPEWSEQLGCFYMNFKGKCKLPSVKNMILLQEDKPQKYNLLLCKIEQNLFHTQMTYPISPFIAMGIVLSSFDFKICTQ